MLLPWDVDDSIVGHDGIEGVVGEGQLCHVLADELGLRDKLARQCDLRLREVHAGDLEGAAQDTRHWYAATAASIQHLGAPGQSLDQLPEQLHVRRILSPRRQVLGGDGIVASFDDSLFAARSHFYLSLVYLLLVYFVLVYLLLVSLGGKPATDFPTLVNALQNRRAGDTVEVVFHRGGEKKVVAMTLSPRPMPEVPPTPAALAEAMRKIYADFQAELTACLAGISEAKAAHHPAPGEWNALETVGHLIAVERENQTWITDLLNDDERWSDRFENPTAVPARVGATAAAYPTLAALAEELRRSQAEVVAMLAALPPEFVAHKGSFWRLGTNLLQQPLDHVREHCAQIRAAVQAARGK